MEHVTAQQGLSGTQAPKPRAKAAWQSRDLSLSRSPLARRWSLRAQSACVMAPVLQDNIQSRARPQTSWKAGVVRAGDQAFDKDMFRAHHHSTRARGRFLSDWRARSLKSLLVA